MDAKEIRGWLLCQPRPVKLRITCEGKANVLPIDPSASWAAVGQSVAALKPELIEALDAKDDIIRAVRPEDEDEDEEIEEPEEGFVVPADGESQRLIVFAKLLADAHKFATGVAFAKLGELFETVTRRSESLEKTVDSLNKVMVKMAIEEAAEESGKGGGDGGIGDIVQAFMQGAAKKAAEDAAKGTNGVPPKGEAS
jgi:hypothetical protein